MQDKANPHNPTKSTLLHGKAISRRNALKTSIYATREVILGAHPAERCVLNTLAPTKFDLRRLGKSEAWLWPAIASYLDNQKFARIQRRFDSPSRTCFHALEDLQSCPDPSKKNQLNSNGFVSAGAADPTQPR